MTYGRYPYGGVGYAGSSVAANPATDTTTTLAVEWSPTTGALAEPVWVDITTDVRSWNSSRGRNRELERFQPGRATIVLSNLNRQYDSVYVAGPNYGNIRPMRRIRIRETFNGVTYPVFDGFVDKWKLDYPNTGRDATATVTATDAFKVLARTGLARSVYEAAVLGDGPGIYWRLDETRTDASDAALVALNYGSLGTANVGTWFGTPDAFGDPGLVVLDPGGSPRQSQTTVNAAGLVAGMGLTTQFDPFGSGAFVIEAWAYPIRRDDGFATNECYIATRDDPATNNLILCYTPVDNNWRFVVANDAAATFTATTVVGSSPPRARYHVVARFVVGEPLTLWINGTATTGTTPTGAFTAAAANKLAAFGIAATPGSNNFSGNFAHFAVYTGARATAVDAAWVARHYAAGTAPWQSDLPGARAGRVLDLASWPSTARELDAGITTLQSAALEGQTVLEHAQKVAETEFGLLFITRDGKVRFVGRTGLFAREPAPAVYGDQAAQVGYRDFVPDDGDEVIRNRAIISRLNGVAQTATDAASITAYGPFEYTLEGLLHQSDSYSLDYGNLIVDEYGIQQRRIASLTVGPPISGQESIVYPAMLGPELGDAVTVTNTPVGGGSAFTQVCGVEGIQASGAPGGVRTTTFTLSPEFAIRTLEDIDVATLGYAEVTASQGTITAEVDLTSLTVTATVGSSRRIQVTGSAYFTNTGAVGTDILKIHQDGVQIQERSQPASTAAHTVTTIAVETPSAGSHTWKLRAQATAGTATSNASATFPAFILVEDIGPA